MNNTVIGIDVGHSAVKISPPDAQFLFPAMILPAFTIQDEMEAMRCERESVVVNGRKFFYGETALAQSAGDTSLGLNDGWMESDHHEALVAAAVKELKIRGYELGKDSMIVAGLPIKSFTESKSLITEQFKRLVKAEIEVVPQPFAPFFYSILDREDKPVLGMEVSKDSFAVCDIGRFTTDIVLMRKGRFNQSGSAEGARLKYPWLRALGLRTN